MVLEVVNSLNVNKAPQRNIQHILNAGGFKARPAYNGSDENQIVISNSYNDTTVHTGSGGSRFYVILIDIDIIDKTYESCNDLLSNIRSLILNDTVLDNYNMSFKGERISRSGFDRNDTFNKVATLTLRYVVL